VIYQIYRGGSLVIRDEEYHINGIMLPGESSTRFTFPLKPTFTVPANLPPNSIYRVDLVLLDEQLNERE